jgi:outer membrane protein, multidrug efflux system
MKPLLISPLSLMIFSISLHAQPITVREVQPRAHIARGEWWSVYGDAKLDALIREAGIANQELRMAVFRFDQARATARIARSNFFPTLNAGAVINHQSLSGNTSVPFDPNGQVYRGWNYEIPLDFSYEIDLWGRVRLSHEATVNDAAAAASTMQSVLLSVQSEVAQNYFRLRAIDAEILSMESAVALASESQAIAESKLKAGTATDFDVTRAAVELATQRVELSGLQAQRAPLQNAIAVLTARKAQNFSIAANGGSMPPVPVVPSSVPSDLLERRPDIATTQRNLAASLNRLGVAKLAGYPSLRLTASSGVVSGDINTLFSQGSEKWVIGPVLNIPIFSGGKDRANREVQRAAADIALAQYRQSVLTAFAEVDNQLTALTRLQEQLTFQQEAVAQAEKAREIARTRYEKGVGLYLELVDAERNAIRTQRGLHQLRGQHLIASVSLIKAIGGGWNQRLPAVVPALKPDPASQTENQPVKKKNFFQRLFSRD